MDTAAALYELLYAAAGASGALNSVVVERRASGDPAGAEYLAGVAQRLEAAANAATPVVVLLTGRVAL